MKRSPYRGIVSGSNVVLVSVSCNQIRLELIALDYIAFFGHEATIEEIQQNGKRAEWNVVYCTRLGHLGRDFNVGSQYQVILNRCANLT